MLIKTENGLFKYNRFDAIKLVETEDCTKITLIKYFEKNPACVVIGEYSSYKKALQKFNAIAEQLAEDNIESIVYLEELKDTEETASSRQDFFNAEEINFINCGEDKSLTVYKKNGEKLTFQYANGLMII